MFFEDVDLGWRLWLLGYRVRYVPDSLVFHKHHQSMTSLRLVAGAVPARAQRAVHDLQELRRREPRPGAAGGAHARGAAGRGARRASTPTRSTCSGGAATSRRRTLAVSKQTLAATYAIDALGRADPEPERDAARSCRQARRRNDQEILRLFRLPFHPNIGDPRFVDGFGAVVDAFDVESVFTERRQILVATGDTLAPADGRARDPGLADRVRAVPRARRRARDHDRVPRDLAPRLPWSGRSPTPSSPSWCSDSDVIDLPGLPDEPAPGAAAHEQGDRRRHLRPVPPRAARAGARRRARPADGSIVRDATEVLNQQLRPRRLLPVREPTSSATSGSASSRRSAASTRSPTTPTRAWTSWSKVVPFGVTDDPPAPHAAGPQGRRAGHRPRRQGDPLGRRDLQLVRPADADPRRRQAARPRPRRSGCSSSG